MSDKSLGLTLQNVSYKVKTNYLSYYDYLSLHFSKVLSEKLGDYDVETEVSWIDGPLHFDDTGCTKAIAANTVLGDSKVATIRKIAKRCETKTPKKNNAILSIIANFLSCVITVY